MEAMARLKSRVVSLPFNDIDTDQIIPARYLKTTTKEGLGEHLFADWRFQADGSPKAEFPLNHPGAAQAEILLAGGNFGCGSSREHAPWALLDWGFRAVLATSFADIFYNNALKNGLLPVVLNEPALERSREFLRREPDAEVQIELEEQRIHLPDGSVEFFPIDPFAKSCLVKGVDQLGYLMSFETQIETYEADHGTI
jgi:3-isopropylmalate/(R)-2-methylmalate dehydratase small subunit